MNGRRFHSYVLYLLEITSGVQPLTGGDRGRRPGGDVRQFVVATYPPKVADTVVYDYGR